MGSTSPTTTRASTTPTRSPGGDEHGTHVAGTIAAVGNNGTGITGVSWRTRIMPLKFLGADGGYTSDAIEAINYAVNKGVKISNNSWGGGGQSQALQDAIANADARGHLFVAAAGNGGADAVAAFRAATASKPQDTTKPTVSAVAPTGRTTDRTPVVAATVRDNRTNLAASNIRLYVDGGVKSASYSSATDRLKYTRGPLAYGSHTVRIIAKDAAGNIADARWAFRVVRP